MTQQNGTEVNNSEELRCAKIALGEKINLPMNVKSRIYAAYVKPILINNCSTCVMTKTAEGKIDAFHCRQFRQFVSSYSAKSTSNHDNLHGTCKISINLDFATSSPKWTHHETRQTTLSELF